MKNLKFFISIVAVAFAHSTLAEEPSFKPQPPAMALQYFSDLEGEWIGSHINHSGEEELVNLEYRIVSGGTAVEERIFADTPKEMITIYHGSEEEGLLMTHYCIMGNQPRLQLQNTHEKTFNFTYLDGAGIDPDKSGYMGSMKLTIIDENTIQQDWDFYEGGEVKYTGHFTFTRK